MGRRAPSSLPPSDTSSEGADQMGGWMLGWLADLLTDWLARGRLAGAGGREGVFVAGIEEKGV